MPNILELTRQVLKHHLVFSMWERTALLGLKVSFAWNSHAIKKQTPSIIPIHWHALCVHMLVYTHNMHSSNSANNTLHLFKAGSKEYKQWFMRKLWQCFPIPFPCLCNPSDQQPPSGYAEAGLPQSYQQGVKWKGHLKQVLGCGREGGFKARCVIH